jgi:hypothetical protein
MSTTDIRFVSTNGEQPTPLNSHDFTEKNDGGRGSLVFFNQASMFQGPETGYDSLETARVNGHDGISDYGAIADQAFEKFGVRVPLDNLP